MKNLLFYSVTLIFLLSCLSLTACSENQKKLEKKQEEVAEQIVDSIQKPLGQAEHAAKLIEQHNEQMTRQEQNGRQE